MEHLSSTSTRLVCLPGDGIGPEVTAAALEVVSAVMREAGRPIEISEHLIGGAAIDAAGTPLPESTLAACQSADAVLLGAVGGPRWDEAAVRPERGLLGLRKALGVFANVRPVVVSAEQIDSSPLRPGIVSGTDLVIVRELTGGIYFGEPAGISLEEGQRTAINTMRYEEEEIARVAEVAFKMARKRRGHVTSVDKANVLAVSRLWRDVVSEVHAAYRDVGLEHLYVDNAAMQLVRRPTDFDVVVTGNLFGDILSDLAATLPGSLGMLPSASLGAGAGLFEPVHGSAPDIAGQGVANPAAMILSVAMMLDDLGHSDLADAVRRATRAVLAEGIRTPDIGGSSSTEKVGRFIARRSVEMMEVTA